MAARPSTTNIVRLPTAAKRRTNPHLSNAHREAAALLPQHPAEFIWPWERERRAHEAAVDERIAKMFAHYLRLFGVL